MLETSQEKHPQLIQIFLLCVFLRCFSTLVTLEYGPPYLHGALCPEFNFIFQVYYVNYLAELLVDAD